MSQSLRHYVFLFILSLILVLPGCGTLFQDQEGSHTVYITLARAAPNGMGQVALFGKDENGKEYYFVKDFYSPVEPVSLRRERIQKYLQRVRKYRGKQVRVSYTLEKTGNREVVSLTPR
jgi:hypothetical protein